MSIKTQSKKLRKNLRKLLEQTLDRIEVGTEQALAYARKIVARVSPQRARRAA
jgi:antitoxin (DNA-binding transcriptional repressor) of toxin-antitoxin stability system